MDKSPVLSALEVKELDAKDQAVSDVLWAMETMQELYEHPDSEWKMTPDNAHRMMNTLVMALIMNRNA